jgi:hypothetical protein
MAAFTDIMVLELYWDHFALFESFLHSAIKLFQIENKFLLKIYNPWHDLLALLVYVLLKFDFDLCLG